MAAPLTYEHLINVIAERHPGMSKSFQTIARFIVQNPNDVALESAKVIAERMGVQPSGLVRFAQTLEFTGFTDMQRVFQARLLTAAPGFNERLRALRNELASATAPSSVTSVRDLLIADMAALQHVLESLDSSAVERAVDLLASARAIFVAGQMRSFPVAAYIRYALVHLRRDVRLLDGAGGLAAEQAQLIDRDCVLFAVSFRYYAREVVDIVEATSRRGVPIIAISDSQLSPLAKHATVFFELPGNEFKFTHSLAAPVCLAQGLVIGMAQKLQLMPDDDGDAGRTQRKGAEPGRTRIAAKAGAHG